MLLVTNENMGLCLYIIKVTKFCIPLLIMSRQCNPERFEKKI